MAHAKRRFGQHFLEPAWVEKLLRVVNPKAEEHFWEIGPGGGALTRPLAARAGWVTAFEIDRELAADLRADPPPRFTLIEGDFLRFDAAGGSGRDGPSTPNQEPGPLRVVGNLPYNVASPIMFKLVELYAAGIPIVDATVMLQREVADRLVAAPGTKEYGVLSILMQHQARASRLLTLPPGAFRPAPRVQSALVRLEFHAPDPRPLSHTGFVTLTQTIFTRRRKTLSNALLAFQPATPGARGGCSPHEALAKVGIDGRRRPETLSVAEVVALSDVFSRAVL